MCSPSICQESKGSLVRFGLQHGNITRNTWGSFPFYLNEQPFEVFLRVIAWGPWIFWQSSFWLSFPSVFWIYLTSNLRDKKVSISSVASVKSFFPSLLKNSDVPERNVSSPPQVKNGFRQRTGLNSPGNHHLWRTWVIKFSEFLLCSSIFQCLYCTMSLELKWKGIERVCRAMTIEKSNAYIRMPFKPEWSRYSTFWMSMEWMETQWPAVCGLAEHNGTFEWIYLIQWRNTHDTIPIHNFCFTTLSWTYYIYHVS